MTAYNEYINSRFMTLPFTLKLLSKHINLHDGILQQIVYNHTQNSLAMKCVCGDLQIGYFLIKIKYLGLDGPKEEELLSVFDGRCIEILMDEIEILENQSYSHKMIFNTRSEIDIIFRKVEIDVRDSSSTGYKKKPCRVKII